MMPTKEVMQEYFLKCERVWVKRAEEDVERAIKNSDTDSIRFSGKLEEINPTRFEVKYIPK